MANAITYRSKNGKHHFKFKFSKAGSHIEIFCTQHPSLNGRSSNPHKTHLFRSGRVCFVNGREPKTQAHAQELAAQWAEYYLEYRRIGQVQS